MFLFIHFNKGIFIAETSHWQNRNYAQESAAVPEPDVLRVSRGGGPTPARGLLAESRLLRREGGRRAWERVLSTRQG